MIFCGPPTSRTTHWIDSEVLAAMAERSGRHIEFSRDAAYLELGRTTWVAPLEPVGEVA